MANERVPMYRNAAQTGDPVRWEKYFPMTVVDAIMASDAEDETRTVMDLVREEIQKVVGTAPEAFDTLQEIAAYIEEHEEVASALQAAVGNKVDKVEGKGLSSNDYTTAEKEKLAGLKNMTVDSTLSSTSTNPVQNKVVKEGLDGKVPASRKVNGKTLTEDITLSADDVSAIPSGQKGAAGGVAELDGSGKVPAAQLPSYVDDVIDAYVVSGATAFSAGWLSLTDGGSALTPESGKIYIVVSTGSYNLHEFRWSGTTYGEVGKSIALGETASTAYRGDRGKIAYDHSQAAHAPANAEANVQSDWNETDTASDSYIKNKPASLPANGGDADTVGGHTVGVNVPANAVFTDTKPVAMKGATSSAAGAAGYAPAPAAGAQAKYLRGDGTWQTPPNTVYGKASNTADGLMAKEDKAKLDAMPTITFGPEFPEDAPNNSIHFLTEG